MTRNVPVEYANFDIDADGFIYTVTEAANTTTDAVKKLNPAGYNIWDNAVGDEYSFGDVASEYDSTTNKTYKCRLTDICVSDNGTINVLDSVIFFASSVQRTPLPIRQEASLDQTLSRQEATRSISLTEQRTISQFILKQLSVMSFTEQSSSMTRVDTQTQELTGKKL